MSSSIPISLNNEREIQISEVKKRRKDCASLSSSDIVKKLFFEKLDEVLKP
jgi:hypothetical protein